MSCIKIFLSDEYVKFSMKMVRDTAKDVGETWYRNVINKECVFSRCN